jgi:hypothetical protein
VRHSFLLLCILIVTTATQAQSLSVGGKTGLNSFVSIGKGILPRDMEPTGGYLTTVSGSVFGQYMGKKKWGVQAGLSYTVLNRSEASIYWSNYGRTYFYVTDYYLLDLAAQYELSCEKWEKNEVLKRLHLYIGAGISGGVAVHNTSVTDYQIEAKNVQVDRSKSFGAMILLNQTALYRLNKQFSFLISSDLRTMPWQWNGSGQRNSMYAVQLGLTYHIR